MSETASGAGTEREDHRGELHRGDEISERIEQQLADRLPEESASPESFAGAKAHLASIHRTARLMI
jgi:hypothetical protein